MIDNGTNAIEPIAVIGMACRVPGAANVAQFWENLAAGVESVEVGTRAEHAAAGVARELLDDPDYVPVTATLAEPEYFDAGVFGISAAEAELHDPQHRLFLELAYTALEDSGYDPHRYGADIGVFGGSGEDAYQWRNVRRNRAAMARSGIVGLAIHSHPDYIATLASYQLNLRGPSLTVHTACSTSLVAIHLACEALRNAECDLALAGAANLELPLGHGHIHVDGGVNSLDGHCRAFDAAASGTVWASGGGVVVLKRLAEAIADGDSVRAMIVGDAINNDGASKVGFTAPSQHGQAAVIAAALGVSGVDPRTVEFVEAHGTGTVIGDPIEVAALSSVYQRDCLDSGWCAIGSAKTNVGHLGSAAGVTGLIKAVLAIQHGIIPPSLNFDEPNPEIDFGRNPFFVNTAPLVWKAPAGHGRRAAVSSFGMGGTNAHVILEQAPDAVGKADAHGRTDAAAVQRHLVQLSTRTESALVKAAAALADHLEGAGANGRDNLVDVAYTLRAGRREHLERLAVVATDTTDAVRALRDRGRWIRDRVRDTADAVFLFPGQGSQYSDMGTGLYASEPAFRAAIDECCTVLRELDWPDPSQRWDPRDVLATAGSGQSLVDTALAQPALFAVEYGLARLWQSRGVTPRAMIGHSLGEYVAATCAGVFDLADALRTVVARGKLMGSRPGGAMLAVALDEDELMRCLPEGVSVAAVNGPKACVVSGPEALLGEFGDALANKHVAVRRLRTSHAFHSAAMDPVLDAFHEVVAAVDLREPKIAFASNVTGDWITTAEATDPSYWVRQLRAPVRFGDCVTTVAGSIDGVFVECGPGRQLSGLVRMRHSERVAVPSLPGPADGELAAFTTAMGRLWVVGGHIDAELVGPRGNRVTLPTYPWERRYHWVRPDPDEVSSPAPQSCDRQTAPTGDATIRFAMPAWRQLPPVNTRRPAHRMLVLCAHDDPVTSELSLRGNDVLTVHPGPAYVRDGDHYQVRPGVRGDYDALVADLRADGLPGHVVHCWTVADEPAADIEATWVAQDRGFFSALYLLQALAIDPPNAVRLDVVTAGAQEATGRDVRRPEHATLAGVVKVAPLELGWLTARHIDVVGASVRALADEICAEPEPMPESSVALRNGRRWSRRFEQIDLPESAARTEVFEDAGAISLRARGVYLITGGLGGIGISIAEDLAIRFAATVILTSREGLPSRDRWDDPEVLASLSNRGRRAVDAIGRMTAAGASVDVIAADVADPAAVRGLREEIFARHGHLDGIIHAAGVPGGGMIEVRDRAAAERVLRPKLAGTLALTEAFGRDALDFVVLCSSVTAISGDIGQVDYCAANAFLDAFAGGERGWRAPVCSVDWGGWSGVGMAAEASIAPTRRIGREPEPAMPIRHEVLVERHPANGAEPAWCSGPISSSTHWLLADHRVAGVPTVPATGCLELARCGFAECCPAPGPGYVVRLRDVTVIEPLAVPDATTAEVRVIVEPGADGTEFEIISIMDADTRVHVRGTAAWVEASEVPVVDLEVIRARCPVQVDAADGLSRSGSGLVTFGPHWRNMVRTHQGAGEELAFLATTDQVAPDEWSWIIQPAVLDEALTAGRSVPPGAYLPFSYGSVLVRGPLPRTVWSHLRHRDDDVGGIATADVTLYDDAGREVLSVRDFTMRQVDRAAVTANVTRRIRALAPSPGDENGRMSPELGVAAFRRLVGSLPMSQLVVSARAIEEVVAGGRAADRDPLVLDTVGHIAGSMAAEFEPVIAVTEILADLLGESGIGPNDDFFDMGGNSLIAAQLITVVRKRFGVRLPMRRFFADPTVTGIAAVIDELSAVGDTASSGDDAEL